MPSHLESYCHDLRRVIEPALCALALCIYEMACGFELDGLPAVIPPACPPTVRLALESLLARPPPSKSERKGANGGVLTLEAARAEVSLFANDAVPAGLVAQSVPFAPLPPSVVESAKEAGKGLA